MDPVNANSVVRCASVYKLILPSVGLVFLHIMTSTLLDDPLSLPLLRSYGGYGGKKVKVNPKIFLSLLGQWRAYRVSQNEKVGLSNSCEVHF